MEALVRSAASSRSPSRRSLRIRLWRLRWAVTYFGKAKERRGGLGDRQAVARQTAKGEVLSGFW
ncbi:UNVERIFIED_CONTAM: hypothetical protein Sradi_0720400 [Sesamum radiatum]|uniref:Uncharacterized protein n=1 Tax=Sesamum radiatum TaxID=300843 RepID=A0AAW2VMD5_SESRA